MKRKLNLKDSSMSLVVAFVLCQLLTFLLLLICYVVCAVAKIDPHSITDFLNNNCYGYLITSVFYMLGLVVTFVIFNHKKDNKIIDRPKTSKVFLYLLIGIVAFFALSPIVNCVNTLLVQIGITPTPIPYKLDTAGYIVSIFSLVILPAITEELLMRGTILKGMKDYGKAFSIILCAIMFTLFHMSLSQVVFQLLMGMLLAVIMYKENNILYTILVHAVSNFISLTFSFLDISLVFNHWTYILLAIILFVAFLIAIMYFIFKGNKNSKIAKISKTETIYLLTSLTIMIIFYIIINLSR